MDSTMACFKETLLIALTEKATVDLREALADSIGHIPSGDDFSTARRAARRVAREGSTVLMSAFPDQPEGVEHRRWERRAVLYLTADEQVVVDLAHRVEVATGIGGNAVREGKQRLHNGHFLPGA
ncbi:hypothetical protein [Streptomyces sp. WZ-12]|uniref:hypothetical protein n=1 Tax=Streptomyces sp. WZ-12 TaxID=3030210 RepID=UPI002380E367|nr:hypothetical protein [Streptomyces sp. WZ-12]